MYEWLLDGVTLRTEQCACCGVAYAIAGDVARCPSCGGEWISALVRAAMAAALAAAARGDQ